MHWRGRSRCNQEGGHLNALDVLWDAEHVQLALDVCVHALLEGRAAQQVKGHTCQAHVYGGLDGHAGQVGSRAGMRLAPAASLADAPAARVCCKGQRHRRGYSFQYFILHKDVVIPPGLECMRQRADQRDEEKQGKPGCDWLCAKAAGECGLTAWLSSSLLPLSSSGSPSSLSSSPCLSCCHTTHPNFVTLCTMLLVDTVTIAGADANDHDQQSRLEACRWTCLKVTSSPASRMAGRLMVDGGTDAFVKALLGAL